MTPDEKLAYARAFPVQIGVDTGMRFHFLVALGPDGRCTKPCTVLVSRAGFEASLAQVSAWFPTLAPSQMLVGLEYPGGGGEFAPVRPAIARTRSGMSARLWARTGAAAGSLS